jgi:HlyD family secretion protein
MKNWKPSTLRLSILLILLCFIIAGVFRYCKAKESLVSFRTASLVRGDLSITIGATGTIEPEQVIDVGAQVAGQILSFGTDRDGKSVDYGSVVRKGMVLARIDQSLYATELDAAVSELASAKARLQQCQADRRVKLAKVRQTENNWRRAQRIGPSEAMARSKYDQYQADYRIAKANLSVSEAAIAQAKAGISGAKAAVRRAQRNIGYCTITSPVDGLIIDRRVNIGQTVVAHLNAPSLFLLAKDLKRMKIWAAVNEADVCRIQPGQNVTFTIDALPEERFSGKVGKIRLNASMTQNVVIYTVEVDIDNSQGRLLPYLTANVTFRIDERSNVLLVPNAALHWQPSGALIDSQFRRPSPAVEAFADDSATEPGKAVIWVRSGKNVRPVEVRTGLSDGLMTEIAGDNLMPGQQVIIGVQPSRRKGPAGGREPANPFMPELPPPPAGNGGVARP